MIDMHVTCFAVLTCCFAKGISGRFSVPVQQYKQRSLFISYLPSLWRKIQLLSLYKSLGPLLFFDQRWSKTEQNLLCYYVPIQHIRALELVGVSLFLHCYCGDKPRFARQRQM